MTLVVRRPEPKDASALGAVHVRAWQAAYRGGLMPDDYLDALSAPDRAAMWERALGNEPRPRAARLVAEDDGDVIGFALVGPADHDDAVGELYAINVDPDHWGAGAGGILLRAATAALRTAGFGHAVLWVHPGNARSRRFYRHHGWVDDGIERHEQVLDVHVAETRMSIDLAGEPVADPHPDTAV